MNLYKLLFLDSSDTRNTLQNPVSNLTVPDKSKYNTNPHSSSAQNLKNIDATKTLARKPEQEQKPGKLMHPSMGLKKPSSGAKSFAQIKTLKRPMTFTKDEAPSEE